MGRHTHIDHTMMNTALDRKIARKQRAAEKAAVKEMRLADKGKPTKKHARVEQAKAAVYQLEQQQQKDETLQHRSQKLERQLESLVNKNANRETLMTKADELQKCQWREARVADFARTGFTAARVNRRSAMV